MPLLQGACLANIVFMRDGASVVNLQPAKDPFGLLSRCGLSYFWELAEASQLRYYALLLPEFGWLDSLDVPLDALVAVLEGVGEEGAWRGGGGVAEGGVDEL